MRGSLMSCKHSLILVQYDAPGVCQKLRDTMSCQRGGESLHESTSC